MKYFVDGLNSISINNSIVTLQFVNVEQRQGGNILIVDKQQVVLTKESLDKMKALLEQVYVKIQEQQKKEELPTEEKTLDQEIEVVEKKQNVKKKKRK